MSETTPPAPPAPSSTPPAPPTPSSGRARPSSSPQWYQCPRCGAKSQTPEHPVYKGTRGAGERCKAAKSPGGPQRKPYNGELQPSSPPPKGFVEHPSGSGLYYSPGHPILSGE